MSCAACDVAAGPGFRVVEQGQGRHLYETWGQSSLPSESYRAWWRDASRRT